MAPPPTQEFYTYVVKCNINSLIKTSKTIEKINGLYVWWTNDIDHAFFIDGLRSTNNFGVNWIDIRVIYQDNATLDRWCISQY